MSHPIQELIDTMNAASMLTRGNYHLTLGDLIGVLTGAPKDAQVVYAGGNYSGLRPSDPHSYRGYYSDLSFAPTDAEVTVGSLLTACEGALGKTFTGYKGGDFVMESNTPLWAAHYGSCGDAIIAHELKDGTLFLITKDMDA